MKISAPNRIEAHISGIHKGEVHSVVKLTISEPAQLTAVIPNDELHALDLMHEQKVVAVVNSAGIMLGVCNHSKGGCSCTSKSESSCGCKCAC